MTGYAVMGEKGMPNNVILLNSIYEVDQTRENLGQGKFYKHIDTRTHMHTHAQLQLAGTCPSHRTGELKQPV